MSVGPEDPVLEIPSLVLPGSSLGAKTLASSYGRKARSRKNLKRVECRFANPVAKDIRGGLWAS